MTIAENLTLKGAELRHNRAAMIPIATAATSETASAGGCGGTRALKSLFGESRGLGPKSGGSGGSDRIACQYSSMTHTPTYRPVSANWAIALTSAPASTRHSR